jgi:hypothetical protein
VTSELYLPEGPKTARGRDRWPPPDVLKLAGGALLKHHGAWMPLGFGQDAPRAKVFVGPRLLTVLVSLDDRGEPWGELLHLTVSLPRGYPDWDLIFAVTRAIFGEHIDAMMPIPREAAFIHGATEAQRRGRTRQVFHVVEMPQAWPNENLT